MTGTTPLQLSIKIDKDLSWRLELFDDKDGYYSNYSSSIIELPYAMKRAYERIKDIENLCE